MSVGMGRIATAQVELVAPRAALDFFDQQSVVAADPLTSLEVWRRVMAEPLPFLDVAFKLRDAVSARFGVKRIGGFSGKVPGFVQAGDKIDFFLVETLNDTVMSLSARDRHLDVLTCITCVDHSVTITSSVKVHNWFGRLYMLPVGPAHRLIVRHMLRKLSG
ncbi:DUF2867 domain-containing protein [Sulfitobacter sp.]|uniref:DUF2867 domain-containing protein n=1 Tax=Sulfitobacter sp. TaxID=1903071 RepID=UPI003299ACE7